MCADINGRRTSAFKGGGKGCFPNEKRQWCWQKWLRPHSGFLLHSAQRYQPWQHWFPPWAHSTPQFRVLFLETLPQSYFSALQMIVYPSRLNPCLQSSARVDPVASNGEPT